ncbi:rRNA maturation RNase YbeY [Nitrosomonas ureae]|uniref:Endoribonuclease YbeY n=1 Tax=Nitrosomonas ureae TaxID=44577 RepID=A0A2T5IU71_9PROT|nr:rRNA maturation RNase YbeY [Nitrosomonas ureae]PTQ87429.1 putative rRNA maturation factor [Nitrosomonas ureae]PXX18472.1 putative rRNA maturation factor [Nitrosomonas ureae]
MKSTTNKPGNPDRFVQRTNSFRLMVQYATECTAIPSRPQFRRWTKIALMQEAEVVLRLVDEKEGRELNQQFRNKNYATNVLTFVYDDAEPLTGDIILCAPVINKEAQQQDKNLMAHYAHLTIHGILHLQGYDHIEDSDAACMEQLEIQILTKLGFTNPYLEYGNANIV